MDNDFTVCRAGEPCRRQQQAGSESAAIVRRLEDLMRRCRDGHQLVYQDLLEVRGATTTASGAHAGVRHHGV